jgi:hypothetical protein
VGEVLLEELAGGQGGEEEGDEGKDVGEVLAGQEETFGYEESEVG